ncbi:MAG: hypothetical protein EOO68_00700, partial [Moraxellaceae bacterium]
MILNSIERKRGANELDVEGASLSVYKGLLSRALRHLLLLMSFVSFYSYSAIAPLSNEQNTPRLFFKHLLPTQIAAIGYISSITQDTQGFMWFGGANGLARFDGYDIIIFRHDDADPSSISHSYVNRLAIARDGSLWVATRGGLNLYDSRSRTFKHFMDSADAGTKDITWVHEDRKGNLWLGTRVGLFSFDRVKEVATKVEDKTLIPSADASQLVWSVVDDQDGNIWIAYQAYGVSRYDPATGKFEHFMRDVNLPNAHGFNDTRRLYVDNENRVMAATYGDGLHQFDKEKNQFVKINHDSTEK